MIGIEGLFDQPFYIRRLRYISFDKQGFTTCFFDHLDRFLAAINVYIGNDYNLEYIGTDDVAAARTIYAKYVGS